MAKTKIYFWLKIDKKFFDNIFIKRLKTVPGGYTMTVIYIRLMLESLDSDCILYYEGYFDSLKEELVLKLDVSEDEIDMTMAYFTKCGLIQIDEDKNAGLPQAKAMVMSETNWASYKREQRNSLGQFELSGNGGIALAQIAGHYLGTAGNVLLALIVFFGCFKTTVGLLTAFAETFAELFPSVSYKTFLAVAAIFPALFANVGLTNIIAYSIPVLMFIYPLAIVLVLLGLFDKLIQGRNGLYFWVTAFTLVPATLDGLAASPWASQPAVANLVAFGHGLLPFSSIGMGWILPAAIGLVVGLVLTKKN